MIFCEIGIKVLWVTNAKLTLGEERNASLLLFYSFRQIKENHHHSFWDNLDIWVHIICVQKWELEKVFAREKNDAGNPCFRFFVN